MGGGPAGLAAGIAAREQGHDVMVADGVRPPIDKAGGEGVMPNGVAALRSLGVEIRRHARAMGELLHPGLAAPDGVAVRPDTRGRTFVAAVDREVERMHASTALWTVALSIGRRVLTS